MQSFLLTKNRIRSIMLYARFLANFGSHIYKMDIFENVQNEKPPTNLDRPFLGSQFGKTCSKKTYSLHVCL
jgi:hypothetical protein